MGEVAKDLARNLATSPAPGVPLTEALTLPVLAGGRLDRDPTTLIGAVVAGVTGRGDLPGAEVGSHLVLWPDPVGPTPADLADLSARGATALVTWATTRSGELPVLTLPGHPHPDPVAAAVLRAIVAHHRAGLTREEAVHRLLVDNVLAGGSVEDLCGHLAETVGSSVMVTTTDGRVLAESRTRPARDHACFDGAGRLRVEEEPLGVRHGAADRRRAMVRIVAGATDLGRLIAFSEREPLTAGDVHLLERAATVAALSITKREAVTAVEGKYRSEFLRDALAGRAGSVGEVIAQAASLGWDLDRPLAVVVAETDEDDDHTQRSPDEVRMLQQRFARAWTGAVLAHDARAAVASFRQVVVTLLPWAGDTARTLRAVEGLVREVRGEGGGGRRAFSAGMSRRAADPGSLPRAYAEAHRALAVGRQLHGGNAFAHFEGLGVLRLLSLIPDSADLDAFVSETLGPLATDDRPGNADIRRTLSLLLDNNLNVAETARALFFHYNTLRYRIARLEQVLGPFTSDPQLRLDIALALRVLQLRGQPADLV